MHTDTYTHTHTHQISQYIVVVFEVLLLSSNLEEEEKHGRGNDVPIMIPAFLLMMIKSFHYRRGRLQAPELPFLQIPANWSPL